MLTPEACLVLAGHYSRNHLTERNEDSLSHLQEETIEILLRITPASERILIINMHDYSYTVIKERML